MQTLDSVFLPLVGQVQRAHGSFEVCMAHGTLHGAEVAPRFKQMRGRGMPEGRGADVSLADTGALFGCATSALDAAAGQRGGGAGQVFLITASGGEEAGGGAGGFSGGGQKVGGGRGRGGGGGRGAPS